MKLIKILIFRSLTGTQKNPVTKIEINTNSFSRISSTVHTHKTSKLVEENSKLQYYYQAISM